MPRAQWPNLKDHGRTCDASLLRILQNLQRAHGWSFVTEATLRRFFCEDTGHMPGVGTVPAALDRMQAQGLLYQEWLVRGGVMPSGDVASAGVRLIRVAMSRAERHAFLGRARKRVRTSGLRVHHRAAMTIGALLAPAKVGGGRVAGETSAADFERLRAIALHKAAEIAAREGVGPPE